jgi:heat shock protein HspQ
VLHVDVDRGVVVAVEEEPESFYGEDRWHEIPEAKRAVRRMPFVCRP